MDGEDLLHLWKKYLGGDFCCLYFFLMPVFVYCWTSVGVPSFSSPAPSPASSPAPFPPPRPPRPLSDLPPPGVFPHLGKILLVVTEGAIRYFKAVLLVPTSYLLSTSFLPPASLRHLSLLPPYLETPWLLHSYPFMEEIAGSCCLKGASWTSPTWLTPLLLLPSVTSSISTHRVEIVAISSPEEGASWPSPTCIIVCVFLLCVACLWKTSVESVSCTLDNVAIYVRTTLTPFATHSTFKSIAIFFVNTLCVLVQCLFCCEHSFTPSTLEKISNMWCLFMVF